MPRSQPRYRLSQVVRNPIACLYSTALLIDLAFTLILRGLFLQMIFCFFLHYYHLACTPIGTLSLTSEIDYYLLENLPEERDV